MSVIGDLIKATLRTVPTLMGDAWYYRTRAGSPLAPVTNPHRPWIAIPGALFTAEQTTPVEVDGVLVRREVASLLMPDTIALSQGDEVSIDQTPATTWAIAGMLSGGVGTITWRIEREVPMIVNGNHKGGP